MRILFVAACLLFAAPALAAPTCQERSGEPIACGAAGAMPQGWKPSAGQIWQFHPSPHPSGPAGGEILTAIGVIGLLLGMFALMPEFDGSRDEDWDLSEKRDGKL